MAGERAVTSELAEAAGWQLVRKAGAGASSVVYEGRRGTERGAVKVLELGFGLEEAALLARLGRLWGPALLDAGTLDDGRAFVVTEWVTGESLDRVKGDERAVWGVVHAVARALEELHDAGVRHGDVKPDNVVWHGRDGARDVAEERCATLIDLGLAADVGESARGGTAHYAAPELRAGSDVGPRADVYALGVMAKELLGEKHAKSELARLADAMCARAPGARPAAAWVAERAARVARDGARGDGAGEGARRDRAARVFGASSARDRRGVTRR